MHRDAREPRRESRASSELGEVLVGPHVGILHHVFRLSSIAQDRVSDTVEALVVPAHQQFVKRGLSGEDAGGDVLIRERLQREWDRGSQGVPAGESAIRGNGYRRSSSGKAVTPRTLAAHCEQE